MGVVLPWLDRHAMSFERFQVSYAPICIICITYIYVICLFIYFIMQLIHMSIAFCLENHVEIPRLQRHGA